MSDARPENPPTTQETLRRRTQALTLEIIRFCKGIGVSEEGRVIRGQLLRSGTSVGANYRIVCRARSRKEFIAKLGIVIEELDETLFWLETLAAIDHGDGSLRARTQDEANQLLAILVATRHHTKLRTPK